MAKRSDGNGKMDPNSVLVDYGPEVLRSFVGTAMEDLERAERGEGERVAIDRKKSQKDEKKDSAEVPEASAPGADTETLSEGLVSRDPERVLFRFADRSYRVDGVVKNRSPGSLAVTIHAGRGDTLFIEQIQLYSAKDREKFVRLCAVELGAEEEQIRADLVNMVKALRNLQDRLLEESLKPKEKEPVIIPPERMQRAMEFLRTPDFRSLFPEHARVLGLVGEAENFELGFYILVSRILPKPLHGKIKSASAAGKSTLLDVLARICPPEDLIRLSAISSQALYYMEDLSHRVILLEEDAGMDFALYPLKILQTEGVLRKGTVFRDPQSGKTVATETEAKGPVASLVASTSTLEHEEADNRYLILAMNESREQTEAILAYQRELETLDTDELEAESRDISELYRDALRLIKRRAVINPYATRLLFVIRRHRFRRDQPKILRLVRLITLANQYQRKTFTETKRGVAKESLLSTIGDNILALRLASTALGRSLDEMSPHTRHFLEQFRELVAEMSEATGNEKRFCRPLRRDLARKTGLSASTVHAHLQALARLDYIVFHKDDRRRDRVELVDDGGDEPGGIPDPEELSQELAAWEAKLRAASGGRADFWRVSLREE